MKALYTILLFSLLTFSACNTDQATYKPDAKEEIPVSEVVEYQIDQGDYYSVDATEENQETAALTPNEEKWLLQMREEEKLAHDVYTTLGEQWGMNIFGNISDSEQTHTDSIKTLLDRYQLADPVQSQQVGVFTMPEMQALYDNLVAKGQVSLVEALKVGATIEDLDIYDLEIAINETEKPDIITVYKNLQKGSRNHLRAFERQLNRNNETYTPSYISNEEFQEIINSSQEKGRV